MLGAGGAGATEGAGVDDCWFGCSCCCGCGCACGGASPDDISTSIKSAQPTARMRSEVEGVEDRRIGERGGTRRRLRSGLLRAATYGLRHQPAPTPTPPLHQPKEQVRSTGQVTLLSFNLAALPSLAGGKYPVGTLPPTSSCYSALPLSHRRQK